MSKLFSSNVGRKGVSPTPLGWFVLLVVTLIVLYRFYDMGAKRNPTAGPDQKDRSAEHMEAEIKKIDDKNQNSGKDSDLPVMPILDHEQFDEKANLEHIDKPRVKQFPVKLILKPKIDCSKPTDMLIIVRSDPKHEAERNGIRSTWGKLDNYKDASMKPELTWSTIFVMASSEDDYEKIVSDENDKNGDILQGDFLESKYEDTRKTMLAMKWASEAMNECPPKFVFKVPDNIFLNMPLFTAWSYKKFPLARDLYVGKILRKDQPIRDRTHPQYVPREDYKQKYFPDIIQSPVYFFSFDVVQRIVKYFAKVTPIAMEDGYLGIIAEALGVMPIHNERFQLVGLNSLVHMNDACHQIRLFFIYNIHSADQLTIFHNNENARKQCKNVHFGINSFQ